MKVSTKRILVQLVFFIIFNAAFVGVPLVPAFVPIFECFAMPYKTVLCNFGILQRTLSFEWPVAYIVPLASIAIFIIIGALVGRAMCGWACPLGFFQDVESSVLGFLRRQQKELPQKIHLILSSVRYMVLLAVLVIVGSVGITYAFNSLLGKKYAFSLGICGRAPYCLVCPVPVLFVTVPSLIGGAFTGTPLPQLSLASYIGFSALILFVAMSLITKRFWCKYVCPMGALMSFFNKYSLLHIKKKPGTCKGSCRPAPPKKNCNQSCPMGVNVSKVNDPSSSPDCILCYECGEACLTKCVKPKLG